MTVAMTNYILENSKIAISRKRSKNNHKNQQLLVMGLLQHQKFTNSSFLKISLLSSCQKTLLQSCRRFSRNNINFWNHVGIYYTEARLKSGFRVTRGTFTYILDVLPPYLQRETLSEKPMSPDERLVIFLYRMGSDDYIHTVLELSEVGDSTVCNIVLSF